MQQQKAEQVRPFGIRDKLGYMFGDFGNDFTFILSSSILMKFYTDVMGVSAGIVGTIMMLTRFIDAFTDVTMGRICDRSRPTAAGKFKPWLKRMCIPVAVASFLMYAPGLSSGAAGWSSGVKIVYLVFTYILWSSFCYTGINIPYGSMASAISPEPGDRQSLSTFRTMGSTLAGLVIGVGLPMLAYDKVTLANGAVQDRINGQKVALVALAFSICAVICYVLCYSLVTERVKNLPQSDSKEARTSIVQMFKNAVHNRALISIIVASIVQLLAQLTMQSMNSYIYPDYYNNASAQGVSTILMVVAMLIAAFLTKPLSEKFGKAEVAAISNLFTGIVCLVTFLVRPQSVWVFCFLQMLNWLGLGMFSMVCWALITDVIDYAELKNGIREDGSVYALYSFARKLGQAVASGLSGWLLEAIHYNNQAIEQGVAQTQAVKNGIFNISTLVPCAGFILLAAALWFWYPLHKKQVEENVALLKAKHEQQ